ncbi:hypothetical protein, partial [Helicobacter sp. UBA3407]|uniref:hypothetical protein n=1 Tax=Helicobacter sp. UBA3407 TaxID=1946588 RepID=UPI002633B8C4
MGVRTGKDLLGIVCREYEELFVVKILKRKSKNGSRVRFSHIFKRTTKVFPLQSKATLSGSGFSL